MRKIIFFIIYILFACPFLFGQVRVSILGDSYSTFSGYVHPEQNKCFYRKKSKFPNNVHDVKKTWWWIVLDSMKYTMLINNSYSGATICNTGYGKNDYKDRSFVTRMKDIGNPDILFIFGGTNDCWASSPLGNYMYSNWKPKDLYKFRPAFCYMISYLKEKHPQMRIINICNSDLYGNYNSSMAEICKHYNIENIVFDKIDKQFNHPSIAGMQQIAQKVIKQLSTKHTK